MVVGGSAVGPVGEVVQFAVFESGLAVGEHAALVAQGGGAALGGGPGAGGPAQVKDLTAPAQDGGDDPGVTR